MTRISLVMALLFSVSAVGGELPVIKAGSDRVTIRVGESVETHSWILAPEAAPDVFLADIIGSDPVVVSFITDIDSAGFAIAAGDTCDFVIRWDEQDCWTRVIGREFVPAATFDAAYQEARRGRILFSVPEVYEMVNVAIALTPFGRSGPNFVFQKSEYYRQVMEYFAAYTDHEFVRQLQALLGKNSGFYASLKMNGYAFEFDDAGRIVSKREFDRTGFRNERENRLKPYLPLMQSFAGDTGFRSFYAQHRGVYDRRIACFQDSLDVDGMQRWLDGNFPSGGGYDTYNVVFSPLVSYNQSSTWFESNGFRELQPHVNFPYWQDAAWLEPVSPQARLVYRGNVVFTELNHGYINPVGDAYTKRIADAVADRDTWVAADRSPNYYRGNAVFFEYLNWGLVSLRIADLVPAQEQEKLIGGVERLMVRNRGFLRFAEFDQFLLSLYRNRGDGVTLEGLYPDIIDWFKLNSTDGADSGSR